MIRCTEMECFIQILIYNYYISSLEKKYSIKNNMLKKKTI